MFETRLNVRASELKSPDSFMKLLSWSILRASSLILSNPAEMMAIDYRLGSLDVGKDANLLILSGDPLDVGTKIDRVMIEGKIVHKAP